jgi:hypothetical protein
MRSPRWLVAAATLLAVAATATPAAAARQTTKKGIWGPVTVDGQSQFPIYKELGVGVYNTRLLWSGTAATRPARPTDPNDPAYRWPAELDRAIAEANRYGIRVAVEVSRSPGWANGGKSSNWAPSDSRDYARFMTAAVRRYPSVRYWIIWGEPTRQPNWMPLPKTRAWRPLTRVQRRAPMRYATLLDRAYGAIKAVNRHALVVGGNSFSSGDIAPRNWIRSLRLPSGRPPRMDLYGHNPFSARAPDLSKRLIHEGMADFSDLDAVARWVDRDLGRTPGGRRINLYLAEYAIPTDHANREFGWWVSRETQARWIRAALRIVKRFHRIESMAYLELYDPAPTPAHDEMDRGLIDHEGNRKPAFDAFRRG